VVQTFFIFVAAAVAEIAGCFAIWAVVRLHRTAFWLLPGGVALFAFAWLLTLAPTAFAGRAYAAYGGVYIAASLLWLWLAEGHRPDRWDVGGGALAMLAAAAILFAPRTS
jgi:small multidrug resistance family-3 protein